MPREVLVEIARTEPSAETLFTVSVEDQQTIAHVLDHIRSEFDPGLRYRINCVSAQCGACVVCANGRAVRACDTRLLDVLGRGSHLTIEPTPGVVLCDLVTDLEPQVWALVDRLEQQEVEPADIKDLVEQGWALPEDEQC